MRFLSIFLFTLAIATSCAVLNTGKAPEVNNEPVHKEHQDASAGYHYSGPSHQYLPALPSPTPAPSHQHQILPVTNHASFSLGGSALYQHSHQTPALAVDVQSNIGQQLPDKSAPSYFVPKDNRGHNEEYPNQSYYVPRPQQIVQPQMSGYNYAKPLASEFAGYHYSNQNAKLETESSSANNKGGYRYQSPATHTKVESFSNHKLAEPSNYAQHSSNANNGYNNYNGQEASNNNGYNTYPNEAPANHVNQFSYTKPIYEAPPRDSNANHNFNHNSNHNSNQNSNHNSNHIYSQQHNGNGPSESNGLNSLPQDNYSGNSQSYHHTPGNFQEHNNFNNQASQFNQGSHLQQNHNTDYTYSTSTVKPSTSFTQVASTPTFHERPVATYIVPYKGSVGSFNAQTTVTPAPTYAFANPTQSTPISQTSTGYNGGYNYQVNTQSPLHTTVDYTLPSQNLLSGERYPQEQKPFANGAQFLQMQSQSYELPSYYTMERQQPQANHQSNFEEHQRQPFNYLSTQSSYGNPVQVPHSEYGTPAVTSPQASPSHAYLPPSGEFQPPYFK